MSRYIPKDIEQKWQKKWEEENLFLVDQNTDRPKKYILDMFPYPSGEGLHMGHMKIYSSSDILSRYFRHKGFNVLHPMGWDAFGLPAENYAIKTGIHPEITTKKNINNIRRQMKDMAYSYDWSREFATTDPDYYKWTQWIFLKLFERGLAYEDEAPINWCPKDKTGLANEEVLNGHCERCGTQVERKVIRQWILKITDYAQRLLEDVQTLDWPTSIKDMQINWIGRSEGTLITFEVDQKDIELSAYTTRIDTVFGVTALVIAPEHPKIDELTTLEHKDTVGNYLAHVKGKSDLERTELNKEKSGVFTGSFVINPVNGQKVPIWIADYVLGFYGTGCVMLVPAHDERDFEFATKYEIPISQVIRSKNSNELPNGEYGTLINSGQFDGLTSVEAKKAITDWLIGQKKGEYQTNYKLRDWVFSRQRYWGEPIPLIHCKSCGIVPVPYEQLPVILPEAEQYEPTGTGDSPLAVIDSWVKVPCPKCGEEALRETNTMPQWAGSCWYYLRFCDPNNNQELISHDSDNYWMAVDWYLGGAEHAVLHLLYARFWHKVLFDLGILKDSEPFLKLSSVGLVLAADGTKMSKSKGNVVNPDDVVREYGADTTRTYIAFMGPFDTAIAWDPTSIIGVYKFLSRIWEVIQKPDSTNLDEEIELKLNKTILKVGSGIESLKMNTSVAALMELLNLAFHKGFTREQKEKVLIMLAPFAPFMAEDLWFGLGNKDSVHKQAWPEIDTDLLENEEVTIVVQVNGKVRSTILVEATSKSDQEAISEQAMQEEKVQKFLNGQSPKKTIFVPGKLVNFII